MVAKIYELPQINIRNAVPYHGPTRIVDMSEDIDAPEETDDAGLAEIVEIPELQRIAKRKYLFNLLF